MEKKSPFWVPDEQQSYSLATTASLHDPPAPTQGWQSRAPPCHPHGHGGCRDSPGSSVGVSGPGPPALPLGTWILHKAGRCRRFQDSTGAEFAPESRKKCVLVQLLVQRD